LPGDGGAPPILSESLRRFSSRFGFRLLLYSAFSAVIAFDIDEMVCNQLKTNLLCSAFSAVIAFP